MGVDGGEWGFSSYAPEKSEFCFSRERKKTQANTRETSARVFVRKEKQNVCARHGRL
jgi:hypothetical protein